MFGKDEKKKGGEVIGFIGKGMSMEGKLAFNETVRVEGSFKGEIDATGTLVLGEGGSIEGKIKVGTAIVSGEITGTLEASQRVELRAPAKMTGDIKTPTLIIGEGVVFEGSCIMIKKGHAEFETVDYGTKTEGQGEAGAYASH